MNLSLVLKYLIAATLLGNFHPLFAEEVSDIKQKAFDLIFTERFVKKKGEITAAKIPFKMQVTQVHSSCTTMQRLLSGAAMCPVGVEGKILEFAQEVDWTVTVWGESGVSRYGEDFEFSKIKHLMDLRSQSRELAQSKMSKTQRKFYYSTGSEEDVNKLIYKMRKKLDASDNGSLIVHGVFWTNIKPEYVEYERDSDYKGVDLLFAKTKAKEAGEPIACFNEEIRTQKFEELYPKN